MGNARICVSRMPGDRCSVVSAAVAVPKRHCPVVKSVPRPPLAFSPCEDVQGFLEQLLAAATSSLVECCASSREAEKIDKQVVRGKLMRMTILYL
jgi:hypothetical protein